MNTGSGDHERDFGRPGGKQVPFSHDRGNGVLVYRARHSDCAGCALKSQCTKGPSRVLSVNAHEDVRQHVAALAGTEAFKKSARERRKVEMCFAHLNLKTAVGSPQIA